LEDFFVLGATSCLGSALAFLGLGLASSVFLGRPRFLGSDVAAAFLGAASWRRLLGGVLLGGVLLGGSLDELLGGLEALSGELLGAESVHDLGLVAVGERALPRLAHAGDVEARHVVEVVVLGDDVGDLRVWIAVVGSSVVVTRLKRGKKRARSRRGWANLRTHDGLSHAGEVLPVGHGVTFRGVGDGRDAELVLRKDDGGGSVSLKVVREKYHEGRKKCDAVDAPRG
jgi:hypothetical protein